MPKDERDVLEVLKLELEFLKKGGYRHSLKAPWRPQYIFEDSPTCINYDSKEYPTPCSDCVLMYLVPEEFRSTKRPCRHIPLNASGETLDSLYRYRDQDEIEKLVETSLMATIQRLEGQRAAIQRDGERKPAPLSQTTHGIPLYQSLHPKCANPACSAAFHWTAGGKFFRFRPDPVFSIDSNAAIDSRLGNDGVRHYWLCERCAQEFALVHDKECGVVVKLLRRALPNLEAHKETTAA